jgi:hypothetical protein
MESQLKAFIDKFDAKNQTAIRAVRNVLRNKFPTANEHSGGCCEAEAAKVAWGRMSSCGAIANRACAVVCKRPGRLDKSAAD